ncbi:hypothetical protein D3C75_941330 [compost metagenome]
MRLLNKVKFFLGMECIAKYGEQFVITKRLLGLRVCLDHRREFWWYEGNWNRYCTFATPEDAEVRLSTMYPPPERQKLSPLV